MVFREQWSHYGKIPDFEGEYLGSKFNLNQASDLKKEFSRVDAEKLATRSIHDKF